MKTYFLNLKSVNSIETFHKALEVLPLPDYYGHNLDALNDSLYELDDSVFYIEGVHHIQEILPEYYSVFKQMIDEMEHIDIIELS